jgi:hypothetical protein
LNEITIQLTDDELRLLQDAAADKELPSYIKNIAVFRANVAKVVKDDPHVKIALAGVS